MNRFILFSICLTLTATSTAFANELNSEGFVIDAAGKIVTTTNVEAVKMCENLNAHLPSARELATYAHSLGAKGIIEAAQYPDPYRAPSGYILSKFINTDGTNESFYYNFDGYRRPAGNLGQLHMISSSIFDNGDTLSLDGYDGVYYFGPSEMKAAVRCFPGYR